MKALKQYLLVLLLSLMALPSFAGKQDIDMKEILWGHIKDSYEWHITDIGDEPIVINLPVIVKSSTGWHVFCSSQFSEERDVQGNRPGPYGLYIKNADAETYPNKICEMVNGQEARPFDISITKTVVVLFIDAFILLLCILLPARWCRRHKMDDPAPRGFTGLMHMFVMYVYDEIIRPIMKEDSPKYAPYLLTCFFFIFVANIMGIIPFPPGGGNLTGNIACTTFLGVCTFLITNLTGTKEYWKEIFWPDVPTWLKVPLPLMPIIEIVGIFTKPLALIIRLFANMMAGHAIALTFAGMIFIVFHLTESDIVNNLAGSGMSVISVSLSVFMMLLEILVSFIQAMVFTMLSAIFISMAHVREEPGKA